MTTSDDLADGVQNAPGQEARNSAAFSPVALALPAVRRFHLLIILCACLGVVGGLVRGVTTPNQYRSVGKLLVKPGIRENLNVESSLSGGGPIEGLRMVNDREALLNEMQVLSAPALFQKVVKRLGAQSILAPYDPTWGADESASWSTRIFHGFQSWWFGTRSAELVGYSMEYAAERLLAQTVYVVPEVGTTVINVTHFADSPIKAKRIVDAVLAAAQDLHAEVFSAAAALDSVSGELITANTTASEAEAKLREFCLEREIYDFVPQREQLLSQIESLAQNCDSTDLEIRRRQAERESLAAILGAVPLKRVIDGQLSINPEYTRLTTLLGELEAELLRLELAHKQNKVNGYAEQKQFVTDLIKQTKDLRDQEDMTIAQPEIDHPRRERIVQLLDEVDVAIDGLQKQKEQLEHARAAMKTRLTTFDSHLPQLRQLELAARQKREVADSLSRTAADLRNVVRLDQLELSNLKVMHGGGTFEPLKVAPARGRLLLIGGFVGVCCGFAIAFGLVYIDRRVRLLVDLQRSGVGREALVESRPIEAGWPFAEGRGDVALLWTKVPFDRRASGSVVIAVMPACRVADAARVAADLAIGLARHGGEKVVLVSCVTGPTSFEVGAGLTTSPGWRDVIAGEASLAAAVRSTPVDGLSYLPAGEAGSDRAHVTARRSLLELLDRLRGAHRFIVLQLADFGTEPEVLGLLRESQGAMLVAARHATRREEVESAVALFDRSAAPLLAAVLQAAPDVTARAVSPMRGASASGE